MHISVRGPQPLLLAVAVVVLLFNFRLLEGTALAATPGPSSSNITTSPIAEAVTVKPGASQTTTLQVHNNAAQAVSIAVELETFRPEGTKGAAKITKIPLGDPTATWVHFSQNTLTALPGVWTPVQMTITLPKDAQLGYYYAVLFRPVLPTSSNAPGTNTLRASNAVLVLVDTGSPNENRRMEIGSFTTDKKLYEYLPVTLMVRARNVGNIFLPPQGVVYVGRRPDVQQPMASLQLNQAGGRVLPDSSRDFTVSWRDGFPAFQPQTVAGQPVLDKQGQPVQQLHWDFSKVDKLRIGKYYARLTLVYNNGTRDVPLRATVSFWVIPWKILSLIGLLMLLQIALILSFFRYRRKARQQRGRFKQYRAP